MENVIGLLSLIVVGTMLADVLVHSGGTKILLDGLGNIWSVGINGVLGVPAKQ